MQSNRSTPEPHVALLIRHRWIGDPIGQLYRCTPGIPSLYTTWDPLCYGCSSVIPWSMVPRLDRFRDVSGPRAPLLAEELGVRLDLRLCELAVAQRREHWPRAS